MEDEDENYTFKAFYRGLYGTDIAPKRGNIYITVKDALDFINLKCEEYGYGLEDVIEYYKIVQKISPLRDSILFNFTDKNNSTYDVKYFCENLFKLTLIPEKGNIYVTVKEVLEFIRVKCEDSGYFFIEDVIRCYKML